MLTISKHFQDKKGSPLWDRVENVTHTWKFQFLTQIGLKRPDTGPHINILKKKFYKVFSYFMMKYPSKFQAERTIRSKVIPELSLPDPQIWWNFCHYFGTTSHTFGPKKYKKLPIWSGRPTFSITRMPKDTKKSL